MSTRVQKGGPIFRPTPKPRPPSQATHEYPTIFHVPPAPVQLTVPPMQPTIPPTQPTPTQPTPMQLTPMQPTPMQPAPIQSTAMQSSVPPVQPAAPPMQSAAHPVQPTRPKAVKKPRRSRAPSVVPLDPAADPGENIDPTVVTMAAICSDTGQGRVSSKAALIQDNHAAWRASNRERRARMKVIMEAKKFGRNEEAESSTGYTNSAVENGQNSASVISTSSISTAPILNGGQGGGSNAQDESGHGFDYTQTLATSRYNVQIRIGPNGETIVDEESLFVDRNDEENTDNYTHVEESDNTKFINSGSFGKKYRGSRWSAEETELFYDAISQFGENYELISFVLPGRDRKSCKNKFKAEDKKNPARITYCLNNRIPYDIATLSRMTGKDFSGPTPVIRAPTPLTLKQPENANTAESSGVSGQLQKQSSSDSPPVGDMDEEIVGDIESFVP